MSLTAEQRRALMLLARNTHGATEALMLAHGFSRETLARLVVAGLTTVVTETTRVGARTIKVERYRITTTGGERSKARDRQYSASKGCAQGKNRPLRKPRFPIGAAIFADPRLVFCAEFP